MMIMRMGWDDADDDDGESDDDYNEMRRQFIINKIKQKYKTVTLTSCLSQLSIP